MGDEKTMALREIRDEVMELETSPLYIYRQEHGYVPVIGQGDHNATLVLVGEAPGEQEAQTGVPFSGRAGELLDQLLERVEIDREEIYITNVLKDRPPDNRTPKADEISLYGPFLIRQIEVIDPKVISPMGKVATEFLFMHYQLQDELGPMKELHGRKFRVQSLFGEVLLVPIYHPAAVLHNARVRESLEHDFEILKTALERVSG